MLYDPSLSVLTGIQVTIRDKHPVAVLGLRHIQRWFKQKSLVAHLWPSISGNHWCLVFVVPKAVAASFEQQPMDGDTGNE